MLPISAAYLGQSLMRLHRILSLSLSMAIVVCFLGGNTSSASNRDNSSDSDKSSVSDKSSDSEKEVRALAAAYLANRDSFQQMECTYELRQFRTSNEDEIFRNLVNVEGMATGLWVRDGSKSRCEIMVSEAVLQQSFKDNRIVFAPQSVLLDGDRGISYSRALNGGGLFSSAYPPVKGIVLTPFSFGRFTGREEEYHPGMMIEHPEMKFVAHLFEGEVPEEPHAAVGPRELVGIEYSGMLKSHTIKLQFFLAPAKGCLPIIARSYLDGAMLQKAVITEIRQIGQDRAYPIRSLNIQYGVKASTTWAVETRVKSLKVDKPVNASLFQIEVPENAAIRNFADDKSQFKVPSDGRVGLEDLDGLFNQAAKQSVKEKAWDEQHAAVKEPWKYYRKRLGVISLLLAVLAGLCLTFFIRKKWARA
jgi:hypothetical protein